VASKPIAAPGTLRFGDDFELDLRAYELRSAGIPLKLKPIAMELLLLLVERRGELVTREQIVERIWRKGVFLDTDNSINGAISKIRQVLRDHAEQPRFVQTITGKGYRFVAPVLEAGASSAPEDAVSEQPAAAENFVGKEISHYRGLQVPLQPVLLGFFIVLIAALYFQWFRSARPPPLGGRVMLAVLPFENLTGDAGKDYFSDGMTEEMISQLGNLDPQNLGVIARTSVMHYKNSQEQLEQIGRELGVQYVIEGSVRRDANQVRITAQLIQTKDQTHVWARQYDRPMSNMLDLQGEIAHEIAHELQLTLGDYKRIGVAHQASLPPQTSEAYDLYLKGRYFWNKRTVEGFQRAIDYFQQAIAKDPNYARAYAGLADSYTLLGGYSMAPQTQIMQKARTAALKALELDEGLAEAHTSLALITENYDWDWQRAEKEYRRAIELNPNYATAHHWYSEYLTWLGRFDEAFRESERARQLDPLSLIIAADNGMILYYSRQYDRAITKFRAVREMDPNFPRAEPIVSAYEQKGLFADALADIEKQRRLNGDGTGVWSTLAYIYGHSGQQVQARRALAELERLNQHQPLDSAVIAWAYLGMGNKDQALAWLERAYSQHSNAMTTLKVEPGYDPLRSDPRFQDLMRRVGLAQ
jgi:TolB-like protein/DNA-binding winged helix-turn-helix (wHTH) protein/Flp pilus assembly protein TadD